MKTKQTKFMAITSQKGGVGKSTLTVIVASYLYYELGYNLAIIDCDANQNSIWGKTHLQEYSVRKKIH